MTTISTALEATSLIVIMTCAVVENIIAIIIILRVRSLRRNPHNMLILNLSVTDLGLALTGMTFSLVSVFDDGQYLGEYLEDHELACKISGFFSNLSSFAHFMTVVLIAVDRVLIVTSSKALPDGYLKVYVMIATAWFFGTMISLPPATDVLSHMEYICSVHRCTIALEVLNYRIFFSIVVFGFVLPALIASYTVVAYTLWRQSQSLRKCQMSGRLRSKDTGTASKGDRSEISKYNESNLDSACNISDEFIDKSIDPGDCVTSQDDGGLSSGDALEMNMTDDDDDAFENNDVSNQENSCAHIAFREDGVVFNNCNESTTSPSSSCLKNSKRKRQTRRKGPSKQTKKQKRSLKLKKKNYIIQRRVSLMGGLLVLVLTFCWTPYIIVRTLHTEINESVGVFTMWLAYCITVFDPIVYAFMNRHARKELVKYKNFLVSKLHFK